MPKAVRRLPLNKARNVRDLGGYNGSDGKVTRWGRLFRADSLIALDDADLEILKQYNIKTIVDLRSKTEADSAKDKLPDGAKYFHCPVQRFEVNLDGSAVTAFEHSLEESYEHILTDTCDLLNHAIKSIIDGLSDGAVIFHCSAGKDRTGVVAATILHLLGVSDDEIIADYQVSGTFNKNGVNKILTTSVGKGFAPLLESNPETLTVLLDFFNSTDIEQHLIANGLDKIYIDTLKAEMLE